MKTIFTPDAPAAIGPYSQAAYAGNMLYLSGQVPLDPVTGEVVGEDVAAQTERLMQNAAGILKAAGLDFSNVVKTTCYLTTMDNFAAFNEVYAKYFTVPQPARTTVAVLGLPKNVLVEVEIIATTA